MRFSPSTKQVDRSAPRVSRPIARRAARVWIRDGFLLLRGVVRDGLFAVVGCALPLRWLVDDALGCLLLLGRRVLGTRVLVVRGWSERRLGGGCRGPGGCGI
jgi:hypothetical protein